MAIDPELLEAMRDQAVPKWQFVTNLVSGVAFWGGLTSLQSGRLGEQFVVPIAVAAVAGLAGMVWVFWVQNRREDELGASIQREATHLGFCVVMILLALISLGQAVGWIGETIDGDSPAYFAMFCGLFAYAFGHFRAWRRRVGA
jgi:hypothetical protein